MSVNDKENSRKKRTNRKKTRRGKGEKNVIGEKNGIFYCCSTTKTEKKALSMVPRK